MTQWDCRACILLRTYENNVVAEMQQTNAEDPISVPNPCIGSLILTHCGI